MLSQPQEALELHTKQSKAIAATCLAFPHGDVNNFVMGSEDGTVYSGKFNCLCYMYILWRNKYIFNIVKLYI